MRHILIIYVLILVLSLTQAKRKAEVPEVTKLEVVNLGEAEIEPDPERSDVQRKRDSGYSYSRPNRVFTSARFRFPVHQSKGQVASTVPGLLIRPFTRYGPPNHSTSGPIAHGYAQQHRNKLPHHASQQRPVGNGGELVEQEVPSPIRNVDFAEANPIASQNNEPFGMHTANYLPPQNQKLPAYAPSDNFTPPPPPLGFSDFGQVHGTSAQSQNFVSQPEDHQISDAALFLSENAQAIQQLYGAPASGQDFAPGNEQFHDHTGNQIPSPDGFGNFESPSRRPQEFRGALPSYASGTLDPRETLEQIQSLEKDRLIVQLQQALAQAQTTEAAVRYAQDQAGLIQNQELLASISQRVKSPVAATPQTVFAAGGVFSQSPFLQTTTINPARLPFKYGLSSTTAQTPITTTTVAAIPDARPPQSSKGDGTAQAASSQPAANQPGSPVGIPVYGGFVPTFITGTGLLPSYGTSVLASGPIRPVQSSSASPTHFGIPIPTEPAVKPAIPATTPTSSGIPADQTGIVLAPSITPVALPPVVQPIRPIAASPVHPIAAPIQPVLPAANPAHPAPTTPVTSSVQHTYGVQTALLNPAVLYKPLKTLYPLYYYPNVAYQLQKPASAGWPGYPWSYAPLYAQTKPAQIWK